MRLPAKSLFLSFFLLLLLPFTGTGQVAFKANPLQTTVGVGRSFQVTYNLDNAGPVSDIRLLSQSGFLVSPGYSDATRTSTQVLNGKAKTTQTYSRTYTFQALQEGTAQLPVAEAVTANGTVYHTTPVKMKVVGRNSAPAQQRPIDPFSGDPFGNAFGGDPFAGPNGRSPFEDMERLIQRETLPTREEVRQRARLQIAPGSSTVWVGEPVTINYQVQNSVNLRNGTITKLPAADGLWVQPVEGDIARAPQNGANTVYRTIAIPQRAGTLTIPPAEIEVTANVLGAGGYAAPYTFTLTSPSQILRVWPLPQPRPAAFKGAVGRFSMASELPADTLQQDGAAVLRLRISGAGALSQLEAPTLNLPAGLSAGEPRVQDAISNETGTLTGWREFQYTIAAEKPGSYTLEPVSFSYFDPQQARYQTLKSQGYTLQVVPAEKPATPSFQTSGAPPAWLSYVLVAAGIAVLGGVIATLRRRKPLAEIPVAEVPAKEKIAFKTGATPAAPAAVPPTPKTTPAVTDLQSASRHLRKLQSELPAGSFLTGEIGAFLRQAEAFLYGGGPGTEAGFFAEAQHLLRRTEEHLRA